jgi:hypothetical protein
VEFMSYFLSKVLRKAFKKSLTTFIDNAMFCLKFFEVVTVRREGRVVTSADLTGYGGLGG